jgi:hypothetical protein
MISGFEIHPNGLTPPMVFETWQEEKNFKPIPLPWSFLIWLRKYLSLVIDSE